MTAYIFIIEKCDCDVIIKTTHALKLFLPIFGYTECVNIFTHHNIRPFYSNVFFVEHMSHSNNALYLMNTILLLFSDGYRTKPGFVQPLDRY